MPDTTNDTARIDGERGGAGLPAYLVAAVGLLALAMRLLYFRSASQTGLFGELFLDSEYYAKIGSLIRRGFGPGNQPYLLSPLYPYVLAVFTDGAGKLNVLAVQLLQALAGSGTAVLTLLVAQRAAGRAAGLLAGVLAALYAPLIYTDGQILVSSLQAFLLTLALWLLMRLWYEERTEQVGAESRRRAAGWTAAGLVLGAAAALRPMALAVAAVVLVAVCIHRPGRVRAHRALRRAAMLLAGLAVAVLPFTIANYARSGEPVLLSANGGFNFWIGNHDGSTGLYDSPPGLDHVNDPLGLLLVKKQSGLEEISYRDASAWWRDRALEDIGADPGRWLRLVASKAVYIAHPKEIIQLGYSFHWFRERCRPLFFPLNGLWIVLLAVASPFAARTVRRGPPAKTALPLLFFLAYAAALLLFFITGRYRIPIMPPCIALAAVTAVSIARALLAGPAGPRLSAATVAACIAALLVAGHFVYGGPFNLPGSLGAEERHLGMVYYERGEFQRAVDAYRAGLAKQESARTRNNLANALKQLGRVNEAADEYKRAIELEPGYGGAWYNLGNLYRIELRDLHRAEEAYLNAIKYMPLMPQAYLGLAYVYIDLGDDLQAVSYLEKYLVLAPPDDPHRRTYGDLLEELENRQGKR